MVARGMLYLFISEYIICTLSVVFVCLYVLFIMLLVCILGTKYECIYFLSPLFLRRLLYSVTI